jgi:signal transduction histidine kinase
MTATNFEDPTSNEYHWMLEGLTDRWVNAGNRRTVDVSNIPPGTYLFIVKVANRDGIWSDETVLAKIIVVPPFWRTTWFLFLAGIVLAGVIISVTVTLSRRKLNREIAELEKEKMIFLERTKTRDRIARDLHDDLASTVSGAGLYIQSATMVMGQNDEVAKEMIEKSASLLTEAEQAMRDIVWSVSPQYDNVENLLLRIRILTRELCEAARIRFEFRKSGETSNMLKDEIRRNLYLSVKEVLMNAVKHAEATLISVEIEVSERSILIKISDDGKGFRMDSQIEKLGGNGLGNIRKRCLEIGASFEIKSAEGKGTTVVIKAEIEK